MESVYFCNYVDRYSQIHSDDDREEYILTIHLPPIKDIFHVPSNTDTESEWSQISLRREKTKLSTTDWFLKYWLATKTYSYG